MATGRFRVILTVSIFLILTSGTVSVWGSSSLGVNVGDAFGYSYVTSWQSNQTGLTPPPSISENGDLQYISCNVTAVDGIAVTMNDTYYYATGMRLDVATADYGGCYVPLFVPPNLGTGDLVPSTGLDSGPSGDCYLNGTTSQAFGNQTRTVSYLQVAFPMEGFQGVSCTAYWDQTTGVLTQASYSYTSQAGNNSTTWSIMMKLEEASFFDATNLLSPSPSVSPNPSPSVPEMTTVVAIAALVAPLVAAAYKRKRFNNA
jgi:hypothetical protein